MSMQWADNGGFTFPVPKNTKKLSQFDKLVIVKPPSSGSDASQCPPKRANK